MCLYGVRQVVQWYESEKAGKIVSPPVYWVMSSIGAVVLYLYGWLRKDFSIIIGESIGYYIYMWNLSVLGLYKKFPKVLVFMQAVFPIVIIGMMLSDPGGFHEDFLCNPDVPLWLLILGVSGQIVYESRMVYQLIYSYRSKESSLPLGHWVLSVIGSLMIIAYGIIRHDWVLVLGQIGIFISMRNIMIYFESQKRLKKNAR